MLFKFIEIKNLGLRFVASKTKDNYLAIFILWQNAPIYLQPLEHRSTDLIRYKENHWKSYLRYRFGKIRIPVYPRVGESG
jgi:hypothetical protein